MNNEPAPIVAVAESAATIVGAIDDTTLFIGLRFECPAPLGVIEIRLRPDDAHTIAADLSRLLPLDAEQLAQLMHHIRTQGE
ncbi:hypothetical protein ABLE94_05345 [Gordonia sp. VNK1]|uniref:hypothetical protein n=1 Tax=Gordonia oleivorans TaxID=3156618 RepID=UPI0032B444BA